jgi:hypothetical protein
MGWKSAKLSSVDAAMASSDPAVSGRSNVWSATIPPKKMAAIAALVAPYTSVRLMSRSMS